MAHDNVTLRELEEHLVDVNAPSKIPKEIIDFFYEWKNNQGSIPTGISMIPNKGWYIISPALQGKGIIKHFSADTK